MVEHTRPPHCRVPRPLLLLSVDGTTLRVPYLRRFRRVGSEDVSGSWVELHRESPSKRVSRTLVADSLPTLRTARRVGHALPRSVTKNQNETMRDETVGAPACCSIVSLPSAELTRTCPSGHRPLHSRHRCSISFKAMGWQCVCIARTTKGRRPWFELLPPKLGSFM
jgi:hypothetical protein